MMYITFQPQRRDGALTVSKAGDVLVVNGEAFNFSAVPDGGTIPSGEVPCEWIAGPVERIDGALRLTLILPHGNNPSQAVAFPKPIIVTKDGPVSIPEDSHVDA